MYTFDQSVQHIRHGEAITGKDKTTGNPLIISPHAEDNLITSLFVLDKKAPHEPIQILATSECTCDCDLLVEKFMNIVDKRTIAFEYYTTRDIPKHVRRYFYEHLDQGNNKSKSMALAWSRYCKYKNPGSPHCKKKPSQYLTGKSKKTKAK